jgi:catechol 2,3-dioxygenase-like lactoylglutathione lyase family enzyme
MKVGHVSLNVADLSQSLNFYQSVLGFKTVGRPSSDKALLSLGSNDCSLLFCGIAATKHRCKQ